MSLPPDAEPPAYPVERYQLGGGRHWEVLPLVGGRGRLVDTDGRSIWTFW